MTAWATTFLILSLLLCNSALAGNDSWTLRNNGLVLDVTEELESPYLIVATTGSDDGDCGDTVTNACATPEYAYNSRGAAAGHTIYIKAGTYTDHQVNDRVFDGRSGPSGTMGNPITIRNYPGEWPILDGAGTVRLMQFDNQQYIHIEGLTFTGSQIACIFANHQSAAVLGIEIRKNHFLGCGLDFGPDCTDTDGHTALFFNENFGDMVIEQNWFDNSGRVYSEACDTNPQVSNHQYRHDHHVYVGGKNIIIQNNMFSRTRAGYATRWLGIGSEYFSDLGAGEYSAIIVNNTLGLNENLDPYIQRPDGGLLVRQFLGGGSPAQHVPRFYIANNLILDPGYSRTVIDATKSWRNTDGSVSGSSHPLEDLIWDADNDSNTPNHPRSDGGNVCEYNFIEVSSFTLDANSEYCGETEFPTRVTESNNNYGSARSAFSFYDSANYDFRIQSGSIAEDAGVSGANIPTTDYLGNSRTNPDVGAFEAQ